MTPLALGPNMFGTAKRTFSAGAAVALVAGCQFNGLNSLTMPGAAGHGPGSYTIVVELPDIASLPQNSPVMVNDVTVGSVAAIKAKQRPDGTFYAAVTLALNKGTELAANTVVKVAQTSLLGSQHVELRTTANVAAQGRLSPGAVIPIHSAGRYPTTEEVLSSLAIIANKGNLGALQDLTDEMYSAVAGRAGQFADLLPRLAELTAGIDRQKSDFIAATDRLNRLAAVFADGNDKLDDALDWLPRALTVLNANSTNIVEAFTALQRLSAVASRLLSSTKDDLAAGLKDAYAVVKPVADHASLLVDALPILPMFPIPVPGTHNAVKGDFLNAFTTFDLTSRRLGENFFTTSGLDPNMKHISEILTPPDYLIGEMANLSGQAADPFNLPAAPSTTSGTDGPR
jgi:phospholipid/cholesterol/gamma-HCH transport system substrate-binding protein